MSLQASLWDTPSDISLPDSASGVTPCVEPAGPTIDLSSLCRAHASLSPAQAKAKALLTIATYGRLDIGTSSSASLARSLVNRLQVTTGWLGSTLYRLTWSVRTTPLGRSIPALRASARPTSVSDFTGWPTPNAGPQNDIDQNWEQRRQDCLDRHQNGNGFGMNLGMASQLCGWPTPRTVTGGAESAERKQELGRLESGGGDLQAVAQLVGWATPTCPAPHDTENTVGVARPREGYGQDLAIQVALAGWATPNARDYKSESCSPEFQKERWEHPRGKSLSAEAVMAGWPTPAVEDDNQSRMTADTLTAQTVQLAGWATPRAGTPAQKGYNEAGNTDYSRSVVELTGWKTPAASDGNGGKGAMEGCSITGQLKDGRKVTVALPTQAKIALTGWATPSANGSAGECSEDLERVGEKWRNRATGRMLQTNLGTDVKMLVADGPARLTASGALLTGSDAVPSLDSQKGAGGQLHQAHSLWLQGIPPIWMLCVPLNAKRGKKS